MDENTEFNDQEGQNQEGEGNQSENKIEGEGDATSKVKIGDAEYTTEELTKFIEKGKNYDNLLPDYTQKSQKLAEIEKEKIKNVDNNQDENVPKFMQKGWKPASYEELQEALVQSKELGIKEAVKILEDKQNQSKQLETQVNDFFAEIKSKDKDFNEQDFSNFVLKHSKDKEDVSVSDLKVFYSVFKDIGEAKKLGEENALKNKDGRNEKINSNQGEGGSKIDLSDLRSSGDLRDIARSAYERINK